MKAITDRFLPRPLWGLLTPEQLVEVLNIDDAHYEELLGRGLPALRFRDGTVLHFVPAVEDWLRRSCQPLHADTGWPADLKRIADHFDPPPPDKVGTEYVAHRLGCTPTWIADLARQGEIPPNCVVPGTGDGKPWKFHRPLIDRWIETR
jgi:hypothetical protein